MKHMKKIETYRIAQLYEQNTASQWTGLANAFIFLAAVRGFVDSTRLAVWLAAVLAIFIARSVIRARYERAGENRDTNYWENVFAGGILMSGLSWGAASLFLLPESSVEHHAFLGFLLAGTTAGAAVAYCTSKRALYAFIFPSLIPFGIELATHATTLHHLMALMLFLYLGIFTKITRRMNENTLMAVRLHYKNEDLVEEVREAQHQVAHTVKMAALGEMAGGIAHEINNPLGIIRGSAQLMSDLSAQGKLTPERIKIFSDQIDRTVDRIAKIVVGLKYFAREGENEPLETHPLSHIIEDTLGYCRARYKSHGVQLEVGNVRPGLAIPCRDVQISQVLLNLLNNAFDAVRGKPEALVKIDVREKRDEIEIAVVDNGPGIPRELQTKIMQPFFTTKEVGKGTGLGLCVAKGIVESHGGRLFLDTLNSKTRFVISLPLKEQGAQPWVA
ncbi:MAG: ATP-binding protein [Bdellovibrionia bacterium]